MDLTFKLKTYILKNKLELIADFPNKITNSQIIYYKCTSCAITQKKTVKALLKYFETKHDISSVNTLCCQCFRNSFH